MNKRALFSDNGTLSDFSRAVDDYKVGTKVVPVIASEDAIYIGSRLPFNHLFFKLKTPNTATSALNAKYWDGNSWQSFVEMIDETDGFKQSGFVNFTPDRNKPWLMSSTNYGGQTIPELSSVVIYDLYWIKFTFTVDLDLTTELQWIGNLFSSDADLGGEYPDFVRPNVKTAFEAGKTTWEEQHAIAARILIDDLVNKDVIDDSAQILNRSDYTLAAVHKVAEIIANAFGDDYADQKKAAREEYSQRMKKRVQRVDVNKNGSEEVVERVNSTGWIGR